MAAGKVTICLLALTALGACTDARGFNAYEATCADQYGLKGGTSEFQACAARERQLLEQRIRAASPRPSA
jgi:hypothetical protein